MQRTATIDTIIDMEKKKKKKKKKETMATTPTITNKLMVFGHRVQKDRHCDLKS